MWRRTKVGAAALIGIALLMLAAVGCDEEPTAVRDLTPPAAPQGLRSVTGDGRVTLEWVPNTEPDFMYYYVWRGPAYKGDYDKLGTTTDTRFVDQTAQNTVTYYYAVSAVDRSGNESDFSREEVYDTPRPEGSGLILVNAAANPSGPAGYDFSARARRLASHAETDIYYTVEGGVRLLVARDLETDIQDAGYHELDALDWVPDGGWSPTGTAEVILGHCYYVWTRTWNFAKVRVTSVDDARVVLDWAYQLDPGNPELAPTRPLSATRLTPPGAGPVKASVAKR